MPGLNDLLMRHGQRVRVQVVYDRAFFDRLETSYKLFEPLCSYKRYHELLDEADVAFLPLAATRFNEHKSDLKFIECLRTLLCAWRVLRFMPGYLLITVLFKPAVCSASWCARAASSSLRPPLFLDSLTSFASLFFAMIDPDVMDGQNALNRND